jgi:hypothetical protein
VLCRKHICEIQRNLQFSNLGGEFLKISCDCLFNHTFACSMLFSF